MSSAQHLAEALPAGPGRRWRRRLLVLLLLATVAAWLAWQAAPRNPFGALQPVNATQDGNEAHLMLGGYDVVAYFALGQAQPGLPQFQSMLAGVSFRFARAEHKALFDASPSRYLPLFGGFCAHALSQARVVPGNPALWRIRDERLLLFADRQALDAFEAAWPLRLAHAQHYWDSEVKGMHSTVQTTWRTLVPAPQFDSVQALRAAAQAPSR